MKLPEISAALLLVLIPTVYLLSRRVLDSKRKEKGKSFHLPTPEEALPHWKGKRISPVSVFDSTDPANIQCYCPATGQSLGKFPAHTRDDMNVIIDKAHKAQKNWKSSTFSQRRTVLNTISKYINDHQEQVARIACRDTGKTMLDASLGEILVTLEKLNWIVAHGEQSLAVSKRPGPTNILMSYKGAEIRYEPLGVVAAMVSWNYPLHNLMGPIAAALFTGNAIVVKCSESVVWSSLHFLEIAKEALRINGFDEDLVQLIACWPQDADFLTSHPGLNHITFIGSRPVAHQVATAAAVSLTPVVCELGGKDPLIVLDDVTDRTLEGIASIILRGTFQSSGQNCIGVERVIALPNSYNKLIPILEKTISQIRLGSSIDQQEVIDMGATINGTRFDMLESLVQRAVAQGAKLVHGGSRYSHPKYPQGHYFTPTFLIDVTQDMDIAQEEVFGPILLLFKADNLDHAVDLANSTEYGLGASVFGSSKQTLSDIADRLECGNVALNDFATYALCQLPFGGIKGSGYGKFGGTEGLRGLCVEKSICYDRFPLVKTTIPRPLDYPIPDATKAWEMVKAINQVGYGQGIWGRLRALQRLARSG
ncbi:Msc7p [Sugiyamaella lignohabitans]|uniref:Msc7p n=1 Tax=Sugiyamaella lignohabitans TaxID=796027 RepID=A0A161HHD6_9ASCO|nr:Msc7p [Sugiyamaella lignohabitans]ANB11537.1 Msc7p [Sugiyamaella lignohabitans]